jgi:hypothetical protein
MRRTVNLPGEQAPVAGVLGGVEADDVADRRRR